MTRSSEIREALEAESSAFPVFKSEAQMNRWILVFDAARRYADLLDKFTCPNCGGSGRIPVLGGTPSPTVGCPDCGGSGNAIPTEWVEAVAKAIYEVEYPDDSYEDALLYDAEPFNYGKAEAALLVVVEKIKEEL